MSELIDNRHHRVEALKTMIRELHDGADPEALKGRFRSVLDHVGPTEISAMETELMAEGMPETEIRRMCDLHVAVFRDKLEQRAPAEAMPGHPVHTMRRENERIHEIVAAYRELAAGLAAATGPLPGATAARWRELQESLRPLDAHYKRKEYLLFPFLERAGITAPPKVMWSVDDSIREQAKAAAAASEAASEASGDDLRLIAEVVLTPFLEAVAGMVEKEECVLLPMATENLTDGDWGQVLAQWDELGPAFVTPEKGWTPPAAAAPAAVAVAVTSEAVRLPSGVLSGIELVAMLDTLPVDITFVDADDRVAYFSEGRDRVFARNRAILGRRVQDCHPPASIHIVQRVLDEMRAGSREVAEFWIPFGPRFVHIRYFAMRGEGGAYLGCLEVTQDVTAIRALEGQRRLLDEGGVA
jgi:uncharacterized protein